jgi:hypothetical protein
MNGTGEGHDSRTMARAERGGGRLPQEDTGDCPACAGGRIRWQRCTGPDSSPVLYAGACRSCGQWAGQCPVCGDRVRLDDGLVECPCETCFALLPHTRTSPRIEIVTVETVNRGNRGNEVRHTYAVPEE